MPTIDIPEIKQALADQQLFERAFCDCIEAFARFATAGRPVADALVALDSWRNVFEKMRERRQ